MDLYKIKLDDSAFNRIGRPNKARLISRATIGDLAISCLRAFQAKVPIDTKELRSDIKILEMSDNTATIGVENVPHFGRRKKPVQAPDLAKQLNVNRNFKRSQTSIGESDTVTGATYTSIGAGAPTAGWIASGRQAFLNASRKYLKKNGR